MHIISAEVVKKIKTNIGISKYTRHTRISKLQYVIKLETVLEVRHKILKLPSRANHLTAVMLQQMSGCSTGMLY